MKLLILFGFLFFLILTIYIVYRIRKTYDDMVSTLINYGYSIDIITLGGECTIRNFLKIGKKITYKTKSDIKYKNTMYKMMFYMIILGVSFISSIFLIFSFLFKY